MTVKGREADEYINRTDRRSWIHDGTNWRERPFVERILAIGGGAHQGTQISTNSDPWWKLPQIAVPFNKKLVAGFTDLLVFGHVEFWMNTSEIVAVCPKVDGVGTLTGGNPPPQGEMGGVHYFNWAHTIDVNFNQLLTDIPAGPNTMNIMAGTLHGYMVRKDGFRWSMEIWEVNKQ